MKSKILLFSFSLLLINCFGQIGFEEHIIIDNTLNIDGGANAKSADIDNDGDQDIISYSDNDSIIAFHENENGLGLFKPLQLISDSYRITALYLIDIDY